MNPLSMVKVYRWSRVSYPVFSEDVIFPNHSQQPICPHCHDDFAIFRIVTVSQYGFWRSVHIACCSCQSCKKTFAVRRFESEIDEDIYPDITHIADAENTLLDGMDWQLKGETDED